MKRFLHLLMAVLFTLSAGGTAFSAQAARAMEPFLNTPIETGSSRPMSRGDIETAMIRAGMERDWRITRNADGTLNAHLSVRTHTLDVTIRIHEDQYDFIYRDSTNLDYKRDEQDRSQSRIHPAYNRWLKNLQLDFRKEFSRY